LPNVELVQVENAFDPKDCLANFTEGNVGRDALEKDV
jgi:hypothetical protein